MTCLLPVVYAMLLSQTPAPALRGTVWDDASGEPISGALVVLVEAGRQTRTDSAGRYELSELQSGKYHLSVTRLGYQLRTIQVLLAPTGELHVDLSLVPLAVQLSRVDISGRQGLYGMPLAAPVLVAPIGSRALTYEQVRSNPMLAEPDFMLAVGTTGDNSAAPESPTMINVRGGGSDQSSVLLDGVPVYSPVHANGSYGALNPDALQSIELHGGIAPARFGGALSSVIELRSLDTGPDKLRVRGGASMTSARMMLEGPLFGSGARFLLSGRGGSPTFVAGKPDAARLSASSSDFLAKLSANLAGGTLAILSASVADRAFFSSSDPTGTPSDSSVSTIAGSRDFPGGVPRHGFEWGSNSHALSWHRATQWADFTVRIWRASYEAEVGWSGKPAPTTLASSRQTNALESRLTFTGSTHQTSVGLEMQRDRASYSVSGAGSTPLNELAYRLDSRLTAVGAFVDEAVRFGERWELMGGARGILLSGRSAALEPRIALRFRPVQSVSVALGFGRTHQAAQSLRNPESLVGGIVGADLPILAGTAGAPFARADQVAAAVEMRPAVGMRIVLDGYTRRLDRLLLVAPDSSHPFAVEGFETGRGRTSGLAVAADWEHGRFLASSSLGISRVITSASQAVYQPSHAATLMLAGGIGYRPSPRTTWRAAAVARSGRRTTQFEGPLEYEGCNTLIGGCEIYGTPERATGPLGAERLPAYIRLDLGVRRAWQAHVLGRGTEIEGHLTLSNVLGRRNVWGVLREPGASTTLTAPLRPFSLLNAGIDWRY
ncbi:MAG: TonB-dependent receptor [Gemmatimonadaceae bacterium]